jgi:glycosyltransferase involved in cell wall biosynthesis
MSRSILYISHPVDFGNLAYERGLLSLLGGWSDLRHCRYGAGDLGQPTGAATAARRARDAWALRGEFRAAAHEGRLALLHGISPALFTLPLRHGVRSAIFVDWTRRLAARHSGRSAGPAPIAALHRRALLSAERLLCTTSAAADSLLNDYGVPQSRIRRVPMPVEVERYRASPAHDGPPRLLFVGGDFHRKGGDLLLSWYGPTVRRDIELTLVTASEVAVPPEIRVVRIDPTRGVVDEYARHDILALPTRWDSGPVALAEAACAGLALATTRAALAARDLVEPGGNGFVADSPEDFVRRLDALVADRAAIASFKHRSRQRMEAECSRARLREKLDEALFG